MNSNSLFLMIASAACGAVVPMLGPVGFGDFDSDPSSPTAWIAFFVAAPTLVLLILKDPKLALDRRLKLLWSLSFAAFALHVWFGAGPAHEPPASGVLLAAMWAVTVWSAWRRPDVIWPQAVVLLILTGATIVTTYNAATPLQCVLGGAFAVAVVAAVVVRSIRLDKDIKAIERGPSGTLKPTAPEVSVTLLAQQALRDLQGKEVQIAATYSYLWLADQVGHFGLGMALSLFLGEAASLALPFHLAPAWSSVPYFAGFAAAAIGVCGWEAKSYRDAVRSTDGPFPVDKQLLARNAIIAAFYMLLGTIEGGACRLAAAHQIPILVAVSFLAVVAAKPWVRQKIVWQKAGLPYLFRLADARHSILEQAARHLQAMVAAAAPPHAPPQQVLLAGPVGSGRTKLASGIGTELAFRDKKVRYVSLDRLIEFATASGAVLVPPKFGDDLGPTNIDYWPWAESQVLIIDDIGPVLGAAEEEDLEHLLHTKLRRLQDCMVDRHTVWILGDLGAGDIAVKKLHLYAEVIGRFCRSREAPMQVLLQSPGPQHDEIRRIAA